MASKTSLEITGYRGEPVPHTFFRQEQETSLLAIIFPGYEYNIDMPVLYYLSHLLREMGADLLSVEYDYARRADFPALPDKERMSWLYADAAAACGAALKQRAYRQIVLAGKSIGTLAMGHLLATEPRVKAARYIWLTPLLHDKQLRAQITLGRPRSLFVIGTADGHFAPSYLEEVVEATQGQSLVIENANHGLEVKGRVDQSLKALERVVAAAEAFLKG